jgi:hypothetical protein
LQVPSMDANDNKAICTEVVTAYSHCPRKAFLLHCTNERGAAQEYLQMLEECANVSRARHLAVLHQTSTRIIRIGDRADRAISLGIDELTGANLKAGDLEAYCDVLTKVGTRNSAAYEPTIVLGTPGVQREQILRLSFAGYVLGQVQGTTPAVGILSPSAASAAESIFSLNTKLSNR